MAQEKRVAGVTIMNIIGGVAGGPSRIGLLCKRILGDSTQARVAALGLLLVALPCSAQAFQGLSLASVNGAIGTSDLRASVSATSHRGGEDDAAFPALRSCAQGLAPPGAADAQQTDQYADLRAYARSIGADAPRSGETAGPQLADAAKLLGSPRGRGQKDK